MSIKVGIMGYGTIGKRVADAVRLQKDMELVGITGRSYNFRMLAAKAKNIPIYAQDKPTIFKEQGMDVAGTQEDLFAEVDVMVDCSPKPYGKENINNLYKNHKVKAIIQGGEKAESAEVSFNAQANFEDALNKDYVRVVSCNTTGLSRSLNALHTAFGIEVARGTLVRRATDPVGIKRGPVNAIVPAMELPSHHGPDVRSVIHDLEVFTTAMIVPTTLMHVHTLNVQLKGEPSIEEVREVFRKTSRLRVIPTDAKITSTAEIMEYAKDLGKPRGDMMDLCLWDKGMGTYRNELFVMQAVHQESIVVPDNIDAIRAMMGESDARKSMILTNKSLGLNNPDQFEY